MFSSSIYLITAKILARMNNDVGSPVVTMSACVHLGSFFFRGGPTMTTLFCFSFILLRRRETIQIPL